MEPRNFIKEFISTGVFERLLAKNIIKLFFISLIILPVLLMCQCEGNERFYRPNLPEKLCSIGIIDADNTLKNYTSQFYTPINFARYISFEKSYQVEYPEEIKDSLRDFSFTISLREKELYKYRSDAPIKDLVGFKLPDNLEFSSEEKYYLRANEKSTSEISAEISIPEPPLDLKLISFNKETVSISQFEECRRPFDDILKYAIFNFSFRRDISHKSYYAILLEGTGINQSLAPGISGYLDFSMRESNTPGFIAVFYGLKMFHLFCIDRRNLLNESPVYAYFIDGSKISGNTCNVTLSVKFNDGYSLFDTFTSFRVILLSIPEELYLFEKSLYSYSKVSGDPFSEPVYLNGNIKGGNGVFAICRSSEIPITLPFPWY